MEEEVDQQMVFVGDPLKKTPTDPQTIFSWLLV